MINKLIFVKKRDLSFWWSYKAFSLQGERVKGRCQAASAANLAEALLEKNLQLISCRRLVWPFRKVSFKRAIFQDFVRHMAALLKAGFSLEEALAAYEGPASFQPIVRNLLTNLRQGMTFSEAFKKEIPHKDPLIFVFVEVAEKRGHLAQGFEGLALYLQEKSDLKNKVLNSLGYPLLLFTLILFLVSFLLTEVVPELESFLLSTGSELPVHSKLLMSLSTAIGVGAFPFLGLVLGSVLFLTILSKSSEKGAVIVGGLAAKVPFLGSLFDDKERLLFLQNLRLLLESEIPLIDAIKTSTTGNALFFQNKIQRVSQDIIAGQRLSQAFEKQQCLDSRSLRFIKAGELTGQLPTLLADLVGLLKKDLDRKKDRFVALLEPASLLLVGGVLIWVVVAFFLPFYEHLTDVDF